MRYDDASDSSGCLQSNEAFMLQEMCGFLSKAFSRRAFFFYGFIVVPSQAEDFKRAPGSFKVSKEKEQRPGEDTRAWDAWLGAARSSGLRCKLYMPTPRHVSVQMCRV